MADEIVVKVEQRHIDKASEKRAKALRTNTSLVDGGYDAPCACAVAEAANEVFGEEMFVSYGGASPMRTLKRSKNGAIVGKTPVMHEYQHDGREFIINFDRMLPVEPCTITFEPNTAHVPDEDLGEMG